MLAEYPSHRSWPYLSELLLFLKFDARGRDHSSYQRYFEIADVQTYSHLVDMQKSNGDRGTHDRIVLVIPVKRVWGNDQLSDGNKPKPGEKKPEPKPDKKKPKPKPKPGREGDREPREPREPNAKTKETRYALLTILKSGVA